jgi:hypothetical protein
VAALFAASGYSTWLKSVWAWDEPGWHTVWLLGVPFALVCLLAMLRSRKALIIVPLIAALWPLAFLSALFTAGAFGVSAGYFAGPAAFSAPGRCRP